MRKATTMFAGLGVHKDHVALAYAANNPVSIDSRSHINAPAKMRRAKAAAN